MNILPSPPPVPNFPKAIFIALGLTMFSLFFEKREIVIIFVLFINFYMVYAILILLDIRKILLTKREEKEIKIKS